MVEWSKNMIWNSTERHIHAIACDYSALHRRSRRLRHHSDQVTARVCVEYFTIGHPPLFGTEDPTLLGIGWGIVGTWWVGLPLGVALAFAARAGKRPPRTTGSLVKPILGLMGVMAASALFAGVVGYLLAGAEWVILVGPLAKEVPQDRHVLFIADLWAHVASYLVGFVGGIVIIVKVWRGRGRPAASADYVHHG
jgi:hypothetical protein